MLNVHVGLVGAGRIGAFHARTLAATRGVDRLTIADSDAERARSVADEVGAGFAPAAEGLAEAGVDALVIAAATPSHAPLIGLAADAGIPTFCEKPIALDLATMDDVLGRVERSGILLQVGFQRRFDAGYRAAREAVASGALGRLLAVRLATHDPAPPHEEYIAASGGIFRDLHIHDFDALRFVTGQEAVEVYADGSVVYDERFARHGDVDVAAAVIRLESGALAVLSGTRLDPLGYDVRMEVFGERDSIAVGVDRRTPLRSVEPGVEPSGEPGYANFMERFEPAYRAELEAFVEAARSSGESPCPGENARRALRLAVAADRSRAERRPVRLVDLDWQKASR